MILDSSLTRSRLLPIVGILALLTVLTILWVPNLRYPLHSDPVGYAHLSRSLWETGTYQILGKADDVFVPGLPIAAYPFIALLDLHFGMKTASFVFGALALIAVYFFVKRESRGDRLLAFSATALLLTIPTWTWLLSVGNADTFYAFLFFASLLVYLASEKRPLLYIPLGLLVGFTILTRYMGIALLPIFLLHAWFARPGHRTHPSLLAMAPIALTVFSLWFLRHFITFGTWFSTFHVRFQLTDPVPVPLRILRNTLFYLEPQHSLGFLLPFFLIGIWLSWRKHLLPLLAIPLSLLLAYAYPTPTSRFLVATVPLLLIFTAEGIRTSVRRLPWVALPVLVIALTAQGALTCLYTLPMCNAAVDRFEIPFIPQHLGITQESLESKREAVAWINEHATEGATIVSSSMKVEDLPVWISARRFRPDLRPSLTPSCDGPTYEFMEEQPEGPVFVSENLPPIFVRIIPPEKCREPLLYDPMSRHW